MKLVQNRLSHTLVVSVLLAAPLACADQQPADVDQIPTPEERATLVEGRILTSVQVDGRPEAAFTLQERMEFYGVPGASVAVLNDGKIEWARAYGVKDVSTGEPVDAHTLFQAASMSKPVAGVAALQLVEEGLVDRTENFHNTAGASRRLPVGQQEAEEQGVHGARDIATQLPVGIDLPAHEEFVVPCAEVQPRDDKAVAGQGESGRLEKLNGLLLELEVDILQTALNARQRLVFPVDGE